MTTEATTDYAALTRTLAAVATIEPTEANWQAAAHAAATWHQEQVEAADDAWGRALVRDEPAAKRACYEAQIRRDVFTAWAWSEPETAVRGVLAKWAKS